MLNLKHNYFIDSDGNCLKLCKRAVRHDDEANTNTRRLSYRPVNSPQELHTACCQRAHQRQRYHAKTGLRFTQRAGRGGAGLWSLS